MYRSDKYKGDKCIEVKSDRGDKWINLKSSCLDNGHINILGALDGGLSSCCM